jgi:hypothetical protein
MYALLLLFCVAFLGRGGNVLLLWVERVGSRTWSASGIARCDSHDNVNISSYHGDVPDNQWLYLYSG